MAFAPIITSNCIPVFPTQNHELHSKKKKQVPIHPLLLYCYFFINLIHLFHSWFRLHTPHQKSHSPKWNLVGFDSVLNRPWSKGSNYLLPLTIFISQKKKPSTLKSMYKMWMHKWSSCLHCAPSEVGFKALFVRPTSQNVGDRCLHSQKPNEFILAKALLLIIVTKLGSFWTQFYIIFFFKPYSLDTPYDGMRSPISGQLVLFSSS